MCANFKFDYFSSIKQQRIEWLWYPYIPYGKLTLLQGDPGEGKSTFIIHVAALLTRGLPMPDGYEVPAPQTVVYQCAEDGLADTVKPRLIAAHADCEKVAYIIDEPDRLTFDDDRLEKVILETKARLFILDPLQAFLAQDGDMQSASRMRSILGRLSSLAAKYRCAIVLIGHMNKGNAGNNIYRSLGSIDIAAIARSVLMIKRDEADSKIRYMIPIKSNLSAEGAAIAFSLGDQNGFQWLGPCTIDDHGHADSNIRKNGKKANAADFLKEILRERDMLSAHILSEMDRLGVSRRTVFNAKKEVGVEAYRENNVWYWRLPKSRSKNNNDELNSEQNGCDTENRGQQI